MFGLVVGGRAGDASARVQLLGTRGLVSIFNFAILLSTLSTLIPYVFCSLAGLLSAAARHHGTSVAQATVISTIAFVYRAGRSTAPARRLRCWMLLLLAGIPVYVWLRKDSRATDVLYLCAPQRPVADIPDRLPATSPPRIRS
jgi:hypothetical protein